jgi:intracellular septation protein A
MKEIGILASEWAITCLLVCAGLSGKQILFINGPRSAAIALGAIGFAMCMIMPTIGKFIGNAPAHPLTIMGYIFGTVALLTTAVQIFKWNVPIIYDPKTALFVITGCIVIKSIIGRFAHMIVK